MQRGGCRYLLHRRQLQRWRRHTPGFTGNDSNDVLTPSTPSSRSTTRSPPQIFAGDVVLIDTMYPAPTPLPLVQVWQVWQGLLSFLRGAPIWRQMERHLLHRQALPYSTCGGATCISKKLGHGVEGMGSCSQARATASSMKCRLCMLGKRSVS